MTVYVSIPGVRQDPVHSQIDLFFAEMGLVGDPERLAAPRLFELRRLHSLSDSGLAEIGLARSEITAHVFRDWVSR
jgi:hypothetical protein